MKRALILFFRVDNYTLDKLDRMTSEERYNEAKNNLENGNTDIWTSADFCAAINNGDDVWCDYYVYSHYVDIEEYKTWYK